MPFKSGMVKGGVRACALVFGVECFVGLQWRVRA